MESSLRTRPVLTGAEMIPSIVRKWPSTRAVFDRYGLHCCGGPYGPAETISYFSRAHDVGLPRLLAELEDSISNGAAPAESSFPQDPAGAIYRRFFTAGIIATLTAGAAWGAYLLLQLGMAESFGALSAHEVNAHGHAQVFGWIGLFVMGFAYQAFPRFKHAALRSPRLALATFPVYVAGLAVRTVAEAAPPSGMSVAAGLLGAACEIAAISVFAWIVIDTMLRGPGRRSASDRYIIAAAVFFVLQACYDAFLFWITMSAGSTEELVSRITAYQPPLRILQVHGFAALMILGVSQRYLPGMLGLGRVQDRLADRLLCLAVAGVAGEVAGLFGRRMSASPIFPWLLEASVLAFSSAAALLAWKMGVLHRSAEKDRSVKFVRAAYAWLFVALALLAFTPAYLRWTGLDFSHAYSGAARHAITVGFVSLMIVGVASKVVPTLNGVPASVLPRLWTPFLLINTGCAIRVLFQVLTDFTPGAFRIAGVSGLLEVTGLLVWGIHVIRVMAGRYERALELGADVGAVLEARPEHIVGWLTEAAPETIPVLAEMGFPLITSPLLRATVARTVTLRQACRLKGVDEASLLLRLNEKLAERAARGVRKAPAEPAEFVGRLTREPA